MEQIFIDSKKGINHICILGRERLAEYYIEEESKDLAGNIYRGRVENVLKGMDAAFVDIGEGRNAYLHLKDALNQEQMVSKDNYKINEVLKSGDEIMVQVTKEPFKTKGSKVTTHLSLSGRYIVLTPYHKGINVSRKIQDRKESKRLKSIGRDLAENVGVIFRTAAQDIGRDLIEKEYDQLRLIFEKIEKQRNFLPTPKLIYKDSGILYKSIRDRLHREELEIIVNNSSLYEEILQLGEYLDYPLKDRIRLDESFSIKYNHTIQLGIEEALNRRVKLKSGGYIIIDELEALTAIDVNTGSFVGDISYDKTILETNIEAAEEIAHQIKLRNIGGIIIVDFIDMRTEEDTEKVLTALCNYFKLDKNKPNIVDITKLGLVEITRRRESPSLKTVIKNKS